MSTGYTKLFSSIITSTIWAEDDATRIVWITMLATANKNGEVQASIPGLARIAGVSVEACETAIEKFLSPDRHSRSKDDEGRRIEIIDGGWALLNYRKYREMASRDEAQEANRERQRRFYEKQRRNANEDPNAPNENLTDPNGGLTHTLHIAEAEAEAEAKKKRSSAVAHPPKKAKKETDPRATHPAIVALRELTGHFPKKVNWDEMIQILGAEPDLEKLRRCFAEWSVRDFNPLNFGGWVRGWYVSGIPEPGQKVKFRPEADKDQPEFRRKMRRWEGFS